MTSRRGLAWLAPLLIALGCGRSEPAPGSAPGPTPEAGPCDVAAVRTGEAAIADIRRRLSDASAVAAASSRIALGGPVASLQAIARETEALQVPACLNRARYLLDAEADLVVAGFLAFMGGSGSAAEAEAALSLSAAASLGERLNAAAAEVKACAPNCPELLSWTPEREQRDIVAQARRDKVWTKTATAQPNSAALPTSTAAPPPIRPPMAPPPPPSLTATGAVARVTEQNNTWWRFAWRVTVTNSSTAARDFSLKIELVDPDGFTVDSDVESTEHLDALESRVFSGDTLVNAAGAPRVTAVRPVVRQ